MAKEYFTENNIAYEDYNVSTNLEKRKEMIDKSSQMGVPVICIDDEIIVGYDQEKIKELLHL
ncbi:MAG: Glutaredoxin [Candidatus Kaiserbacteria bacterium]|nr:Glutaredoxin [Candidatus Kaiserbacteria bacterium]